MSVNGVLILAAAVALAVVAILASLPRFTRDRSEGEAHTEEDTDDTGSS